MTLIDATDDEGFHLLVTYHPQRFTVLVTAPDKRTASESFAASHDPIFGMDIVDLMQVHEISEKLAVSLGASPFVAGDAMRKPCNDCPFKKSSPLVGAPDWVKDVAVRNLEDEYFSHSCHKTDPKADGFVGGQKVIECAGRLRMLFNEMDGTPGKGGVYESIHALVKRYYQHWIKEAVKRGINVTKSGN